MVCVRFVINEFNEAGELDIAVYNLNRVTGREAVIAEKIISAALEKNRCEKLLTVKREGKEGDPYGSISILEAGMK